MMMKMCKHPNNDDAVLVETEEGIRAYSWFDEFGKWICQGSVLNIDAWKGLPKEVPAPVAAKFLLNSEILDDPKYIQAIDEDGNKHLINL